MAKSIKSLRKGAEKRQLMKNQDGKTPIHYDQKDEVPVFEGAGRVSYDDLKSWKHTINTLGHYIEDHGTHHEAHHKAGGLMGMFHSHQDGEGRGHGYVDHPVGPMNKLPGLGEAVESLDQLYPIFEQNGIFEVSGAAAAHSAGQHAAHHHEEIKMHAKAMARHMTLAKSEPHNLAHTAKISDYHDNIAKKHGHEAARYTHMAAQAYSKGNERGGDATVAGAHKHALSHHGLLPEALSAARAKEAQKKANYESGLATTARNAGFGAGDAKHSKRASRYAKLLTKEAVHANPAVHKVNPEHPSHGSGAHLPPLQSNGGLKKWRKQNGPPDHVEKGPIKTDNVIEDAVPRANQTQHDENCPRCKEIHRSELKGGMSKREASELARYDHEMGHKMHAPYDMQEGKTINDLPSFAHAAVAHSLTNSIAYHAKSKGGYPDEKTVNQYRQRIIDNMHKKMKENGQIKEGKVPDYLKTAARDSLKKQGYKVDMVLRTAKKPSAAKMQPKTQPEPYGVMEGKEDSTKNMKRKYLGKSKGRTKIGTKAHPVDVKPKLVVKDQGAIGRAGQMKMPQPMAAKGI